MYAASPHPHGPSGPPPTAFDATLTTSITDNPVWSPSQQVAPMIPWSQSSPPSQYPSSSPLPPATPSQPFWASAARDSPAREAAAAGDEWNSTHTNNGTANAWYPPLSPQLPATEQTMPFGYAAGFAPPPPPAHVHHLPAPPPTWGAAHVGDQTANVSSVAYAHIQEPPLVPIHSYQLQLQPADPQQTLHMAVQPPPPPPQTIQPTYTHAHTQPPVASHPHSHPPPSQLAKPVRSSRPSSHSRRSAVSSSASHRSSSPTPSNAGSEVRTAKRVASKACLPCRRLKSSCSDTRPCERCVKYGREDQCVDRTQAEIDAGRLRRTRVSIAESEARALKRSLTTASESENETRHSRSNSPHTVAPVDGSDAHTVEAASSASHTPPINVEHTHAPTTGPAFESQLSPNEIEALSTRLYSSSFLTVGQRLGIRDLILHLHEQLLAAKVPMSSLVEWHTQVSLCCLQISDQMIGEDFHTLITGGLSPAYLNSPNWLSSPLAPWSKFSTRPLHYAIQPNTVVIEDYAHGEPVDRRLPNDPTMALLKMEWLPASHSAFQRWQQTLRNRLICDAQLSSVRDSMLAGVGVTPISDDTFSLSSDGYIELPTFSIEMLAPFGGGGGAYAGPYLQPRVPDLDELATEFSALGLSPSLLARPPIPSHHDIVYNIHANWCPLGGAAACEQAVAAQAPRAKRAHGASDFAVKSEASVYIPPSGNAADHGAPRTDGSAPLECRCTSSTPLPARIFANDTFETRQDGMGALFGWRRIDVERGVQTEGFMWNRHWYAPNIWPLAQMAHLKTQYNALKHHVHKRLLLTATSIPPSPSAYAGGDVDRAAIGYDDGDAHRGYAPPGSMAVAMPFSALHRADVISTRALHVLRSEGAHQYSSVIVSWRLRPGGRMRDAPHGRSDANIDAVALQQAIDTATRMTSGPHLS